MKSFASTVLHYLIFDYSEDAHGVGTLDAMASTPANAVAAVRAEIACVLDWAHATFPEQRAPLDDGGEWDFDLQGQQEWTAHEAIDYDPASQQFSVVPGPAGVVRHTLTLSLSGSAQFCDAFRQHFVFAS